MLDGLVYIEGGAMDSGSIFLFSIQSGKYQHSVYPQQLNAFQNTG